MVTAQRLSSLQALGPRRPEDSEASLSLSFCYLYNGDDRPTHLGLRNGRKYW